MECLSPKIKWPKAISTNVLKQGHFVDENFEKLYWKREMQVKKNFGMRKKLLCLHVVGKGSIYRFQNLS